MSTFLFRNNQNSINSWNHFLISYSVTLFKYMLRISSVPTSRRIFMTLTFIETKKDRVTSQTITHVYNYKSCEVLQGNFWSFRQRNSMLMVGCHPGMKLTVVLATLRTDLPNCEYFPFFSFLGFNTHPC